ncbi:MAG: hypothetical protein HY899_13620 [Deltaproteobacteria bacterium]|nr:hypothetical protein [Deltaproteobacteria bacterium]
MTFATAAVWSATAAAADDAEPGEVVAKAAVDEAGCYIDIGLEKPQSAHEKWFAIAGLIAAER